MTLAFPGSPMPSAENITSGSLNPTFSEAHDRAELLRNPCILGGSMREEHRHNEKWPPHPCLLGGQEEGRIAM